MSKDGLTVLMLELDERTNGYIGEYLLDLGRDNLQNCNIEELRDMYPRNKNVQTAFTHLLEGYKSALELWGALTLYERLDLPKSSDQENLISKCKDTCNVVIPRGDTFINLCTPLVETYKFVFNFKGELTLYEKLDLSKEPNQEKFISIFKGPNNKAIQEVDALINSYLQKLKNG